MKNIWSEYEGDNWFLRNKKKLGKKQDNILVLLDLYKVRPKKILDIGCANGYRLAALHKKFKFEAYGVEPSQKAIKNGKAKWPFIKFIKARAENFKTENRFDLIIVNFLFHWIFRKNLLEAIANIDKHLKQNGFLIIGDFRTESFLKRKYHHLPNKNMFTYKQPYEQIFVKSGFYREMAKIIYDTEAFCLLKKQEVYIEEK